MLQSSSSAPVSRSKDQDPGVRSAADTPSCGGTACLSTGRPREAGKKHGTPDGFQVEPINAPSTEPVASAHIFPAVRGRQPSPERQGEGWIPAFVSSKC